MIRDARLRLPSPSARREVVLGIVAALGLALAPLTGLAAAAIAAMALTIVWLPALGLAAAAVAVPFGSLAALPAGAGSVTGAPLALALAAIGWGLAILARRRLPGVTPAARLPLCAVALFVGALALSAVTAPEPVAAGFEITRWVLLGLALVLAADMAARSNRHATVLVAAILAAGAAEAVVGIGLSLARIGPESFAILGGRLFRAHGTFGQPNPFAGYMNMVWPIGAALAVTAVAGARHRDEAALDGDSTAPHPASHVSTAHVPTPCGLTAVGIVAAIAAGMGLVLSWSRGGWLAAGFGGALMAMAWGARSLGSRQWRRRAAVAAWLAAVVGVGFLLAGGVDRIPAGIADRLGSVSQTFALWDVADAEVTDANFATIERVAHWEAAAAMWADRPWLGQGPGHYPLTYASFRLPRWSDPLGHAHNFYLHLLAEGGVIGLTGYAVFFMALGAAALRSAWWPRDPVEGALGLGMIGVLGALAFHSLLDNLYVHDMTIHLGLLTGLMTGRRPPPPEKPHRARRRRGGGPECPLPQNGWGRGSVQIMGGDSAIGAGAP